MTLRGAGHRVRDEVKDEVEVEDEVQVRNYLIISLGQEIYLR